MRLFNRNPSNRQQGPTNPHLVKAIQRVVSNPSQSTRQSFYEAFLESTLLLAVQSLPDGVYDFPMVLEKDMPITVLTSINPEGKEVSLVFSDRRSLRARNRSAAWIAMRAKDVLNFALENHYAGVVINPAGPWLELSYEEMQNLLASKPS